MTTSSATSPTGHQYEISSGHYKAIVTEVGATLRHLSVEGRDILAGFGPEDRIEGGRGQQLLPWPNRIRDGRYTFNGVVYDLPLSEPERNNAIHGLVRWSGWELVQHTADTVVQQLTVFPQKGWDTTLRATITHRLSADGLTVTVEAENTGDRTVPFGYAAHPYFTLGEQTVDQVRITVPADRYLDVDDRLLPIEVRAVDGRPEDLRDGAALGSRNLDTAFTELATDEHGVWRIQLSLGDRRTTIWADAAHKWTQIYTGGEHRDIGLAIEPMTCGPDAFNTPATAGGLVVLQPGDAYVGHWGVSGN
ncbi:MAG: aldose 1-epimerase family protein [Microlunatus sp.]|nr:aldose 1-epimerase family protein [Microlunatus sp.]